VRLLNVSLANLKLRSWAHDYQAMVPAERFITAGADAVVTALLDYLRTNEAIDATARRERIGAITAAARASWRDAAATATGDGVIPLPRVLHELATSLIGVDFVLGGGTNTRLEHKYLPLTKPRCYAGWAAGGGLGYGVAGAIGAALAQPDGTITVNVQADGDLLFLPSALWTAAHKSLPVLVIVNNNRQYGNTVEHAGKIAQARGRQMTNRYVGAGLTDPPVDLAQMARSFGVWGAGPIADPQHLADALAEAVGVVRSGKPALLDVLTPGF
jgi:thiamine pyrophosphate-dependent acetolactate synthase large subunit-like protein